MLDYITEAISETYESITSSISEKYEDMCNWITDESNEENHLERVKDILTKE